MNQCSKFQVNTYFGSKVMTTLRFTGHVAIIQHIQQQVPKFLTLKVNCDRTAYRIDLKFSGYVQSIRSYQITSGFS